MPDRRQLVLSAVQLGAVAALPGISRAADWPTRVVTIVVPFGAGGGADILGRFLADELSRDLKAKFVVLNKPGMSGSLGVDFAAKQRPDGYTFVLCTVGAQITNPFLFKSLPYDPVKDIVPVVHLSTAPNIMVVNKSLPVKTVAEFIAYAKAQPDPIQFATTGPGSTSRLSAELFRSMTGIKITPIGYQSSAQASIDLITGRVPAAIDSLTSMMGFVRTGELTLLGVATAKRLAGYAQVPTIGETLQGFDASPILYMSAPTGTPPEIVGGLNKAINDVIGRPENAKKLDELGFPVGGGTPDQLQSTIDKDRAKWKQVIESAGLMGSAN